MFGKLCCQLSSVKGGTFNSSLMWLFHFLSNTINKNNNPKKNSLAPRSSETQIIRFGVSCVSTTISPAGAQVEECEKIPILPQENVDGKEKLIYGLEEMVWLSLCKYHPAVAPAAPPVVCPHQLLSKSLLQVLQRRPGGANPSGSERMCEGMPTFIRRQKKPNNLIYDSTSRGKRLSFFSINDILFSDVIEAKNKMASMKLYSHVALKTPHKVIISSIAFILISRGELMRRCSCVTMLLSGWT